MNWPPLNGGDGVVTWYHPFRLMNERELLRLLRACRLN